MIVYEILDSLDIEQNLLFKFNLLYSFFPSTQTNYEETK